MTAVHRLLRPLSVLAAIVLSLSAAPAPIDEIRLDRHRNLGKAFYENPTTQNEAVEEFRKALTLVPQSAPERLNYGLALLRAGKTAEGVAELEKVQKADPAIPHTWFNLGIVWKKAGENERAIAQFEQMLKLVPNEPISRYNLGALYRLASRNEDAIAQFKTASTLDPTLSAPHFQLYNLYRIAGRGAEAKTELATFQQLKKGQEGAAVPEDVEWSAFAEIYDVMADRPADLPPVEPRFISPAKNIRLNGASVPKGLKDITAVRAGDFDNDGLADLCVITKTSASLHRRTATGWTPVELPDAAKSSYADAVWLDFDHDYDLDLFLLGSNSKLFRNQGSAGFVDRTADFPFQSGEALAGAPLRAVSDTKGFDLLVTYRDRPSVLYLDRLLGKYEPQPGPLPPRSENLQVADLNNDGFLDVSASAPDAILLSLNKRGSFAAPLSIAALNSSKFVFADIENRGILDLLTREGVRRGSGQGTFAEAKSPKGWGDCAPIGAADQNLDGRMDLLCADGTRRVNTTARSNTFLQVQIAGIKNLKLPISAEVEVKAGSRYQKQAYTGTPLLFGLGRQKVAETIRITWPNGLIQNELRRPVGVRHSFKEAQRLSGSCPIIWTWDGQSWQYITDVLGVAPLGASSGDGQYFAVDHDETIQIDGSKLKADNGQYEIRITEELSEVAYLDQVRLRAIDSPATVDIHLNDKFKGPPFPAERLFGTKTPIRPVSARDDRGRDVRSALLKKDKMYPDGFSRTLTGVASAHSIELDFGAVAPKNRSVLVLHGWVDWADGSTFLGVSQEGKGGLITPYLQVKDKDGNWKTVIEDMGMPAGKPKTIAVDLTGKFLSDSRKIRIGTNLCVYWDEIYLSEQTAAPEHRTAELPIVRSQLQFRGFSESVIDPQRKQPERFVYSPSSPTSLWNPTPGLYTRYGEVGELTAAADDKLIVMGSGDELRLRFSAENLPPLPAGWRRDFLLTVDGWAKDRDANTAHSQSTGPLPFHAMKQFPYAPDQRYPQDPELRSYRERYNTRPALRLLRPLVAGPEPGSGPERMRSDAGIP